MLHGKADPLATVLATYRKIWRRRKPPIVEDNPRVADLYLGGANRVISGDLAISFDTARTLWVELKNLYKNRGPQEAGNQVDLRRGSRVFFGFSPAEVPPNTVFGQVYLQNQGFPEVSCSIRYGDNQMDKVNLPVPGTEGPGSYDNSILLFERLGSAGDGTPKFQIRVGNEASLRTWKRESLFETEMKMRRGRRFGLMF
jgi:hypothetical protein